MAFAFGLLCAAAALLACGLGYSVNRALAAEAPPLRAYGVWNFEALVLLCPSFGYDRPGVGLDDVAAFYDSGRSVALLGVASEASRRLLAEFGAAADATHVVDHAHHVSAAEGDAHDDALVLSAAWDALYARQQRPDVLPRADASRWIAYSGAAVAVDEASPLVLPVLRAEDTAYGRRTEGRGASRAPGVSGRSLVLAALAQGRHNNARAVLTGSHALCGDAYAALRVPSVADARVVAATGNGELCAGLLAWALHRSGHMRLRNVSVAPLSRAASEALRAGDELEVAAVVELWDPAAQQWRPRPSGELRCELRALGAAVAGSRMAHAGAGNHTGRLAVPGRPGVYWMSVQLREYGATWLTWEQRVAVRPPRRCEAAGALRLECLGPWGAASAAAAAAAVLALLHCRHKSCSTGKAKQD
eukprot:m51a1_g5361 putative dolichyl-diphosphooligosaccharide--protein glycosyltransferase 48 kda subunit-like (418) ;mRNA; f:498798-500266